MRIAAGIMMIIAGLPSSVVPYSLVNDMAWRLADSPEAAYSFITRWSGLTMFLFFVILVLTIGGGICALRRKAWGWALSGAICCMIAGAFIMGLLVVPGLLAVIFLAKRKGEFSNVEMDTDSLTRGKSTAGLEAFNGKDNVEAKEGKCPHCGQTLHHGALMCSRCKKWVPNELFNRLCNEDVEVIKDNNLTPHTPSLVTVMVIGLMQDSNLEKQVQKALGQRLNGRQRFNLYAFESYCYFQAIILSAKMKRGCRDTIIGTLKDKLWSGIIESAKMEISGTTHEESTLLLKAGGRALYDRFDDILEALGTDTASQARTTIALASAVYGDKQANIANGLPLYTQFMELSTAMLKPFGEMFLVEEEDFDWQAMMGKSLMSRYRIQD